MQLGKNKDLDQAFLNASNGILFATKTEKSLLREITIAILTIIAAAIFKVSKVELMLLILSIALVIFSEFVNTAVELCVDMVTKKYNINAKKAKDVAAGGVIATMGFAGVIGVIVFCERAMEVLRKVMEGSAGQEEYIKFTVMAVPLAIILMYLVIRMAKGMKLAYPTFFLTITALLSAVEVDKYIVAITGVLSLIFIYGYVRYITKRDKIIVTEKEEENYKNKEERGE